MPTMTITTTAAQVEANVQKERADGLQAEWDKLKEAVET